MTVYIIKRLFLMVVTLFGICLVSFVVINMAPGDPADQSAVGSNHKSQGISELVIERNRERLFLDKPIVFNSRPSSRTTTTEKLLKDLLKEDDYLLRDVMEKGRLNDLGTMATPALIEALQRPSLSAWGRRALLKALNKVAAPWAIPAQDPRLTGSPESRSAAWTSWWSNNKESFSTARGEAAVQAIYAAWAKAPKSPVNDVDPVEQFFKSEGDIVAARAEILRLGQFTVPALMDAYLSRSGAERQVAATVLSLVAGKTWDLTLDPTELKGFGKEWENQATQILRGLDNAREQAGVTAPSVGIAMGLESSDIAKIISDFEDSASSAGPEVREKLIKAVRTARNRLGRLGTRAAWVESMSQRTLSDHRRGWRNWWERRKEYFMEFNAGEQLVRRVTDTRFGHWLSKLLVLDFGESYTTNRPVLEMIRERFWVTFSMNIASLLLTYLIAIPIGIYSSTNQYSTGDRVTTVFLFILYSLPTFWVGTMMIWLLTGPPYLDWFPSAHAVSTDHESLSAFEQLLDSIWHLTLPVICLTYGGVAYISRQMRAGMLETVRQDYIRTARAKGLAEPVVILKHALRNSLIPIITLLANLLPLMIGGSVIIEQIFSIEGLGKLSFEAVLNRDYPVIMTIFTFSGLLTLLGILLSDILYALVDPRISYSKG